jgi:hypothetical protein
MVSLDCIFAMKTDQSHYASQAVDQQGSMIPQDYVASCLSGLAHTVYFLQDFAVVSLGNTSALGYTSACLPHTSLGDSRVAFPPYQTIFVQTVFFLNHTDHQLYVGHVCLSCHNDHHISWKTLIYSLDEKDCDLP